MPSRALGVGAPPSGRGCAGSRWRGAADGRIRRGKAARAVRRDARSAAGAGRSDLYPLDGPALVVLAVVLGAIALSWVGLRSSPARPRADSRGRRIGRWRSGRACSERCHARALAGRSVRGTRRGAGGPLLDACHADRSAARATRADRLGRGWAGAPRAAGGLPAVRVGGNPLGGAWYLLLLVLGGQVGVGLVVIAALFLAVFALVVTIVRRNGDVQGAEPGVPLPPSTRGPLSYAGPGSLGGTDSALRR